MQNEGTASELNYFCFGSKADGIATCLSTPEQKYITSRFKNAPLGVMQVAALAVVPVVHKVDVYVYPARPAECAHQTLTQQGAWVFPVDPPGQPWPRRLMQIRCFLGISAVFCFGSDDSYRRSSPEYEHGG